MAVHPSQRFDRAAAGYAATMAPSLRPVAAEVIRRAHLFPDERVIDLGTGTGTAAGMAVGEGRTVIGIDAAPGMLDIARADHPDVEFRLMDFVALEYGDASFDVVLAVHALLFADDRVASLREWRRVTRPGGRLSLSVPGPSELTPPALYAEVYERFDIAATSDYPTLDELAGFADGAGWSEIQTVADPDVAIVLADEAAFRTWREIGQRGTSSDITDEEHRALTDAMLAVTPREGTGYRIPFGALFLTARRDP